jgi:hypothetical protein
MYFLAVFINIETWSLIFLCMGYLTALPLKTDNVVIATQICLFVFNKATVMHYLKVTLSLFITRSVKWWYSHFERKWGTFSWFS